MSLVLLENVFELGLNVWLCHFSKQRSELLLVGTCLIDWLRKRHWKVSIRDLAQVACSLQLLLQVLHENCYHMSMFSQE